MADKNRKSTQFIPGWPTSHAPKNTTESVKTSSIHEESLDLVPTNELQQGQLYIIKIKLIAIALFQGWDDEMCCFSILRTDLLEDLRWSEARYLPENFDAYLAFDYAGNPPIHLWTKHLRAVIPINWFNIFEEARHMQRQWNVSYWDAPAIESAKPFYSLTDSPVTELDDEEDVIQEGTVIGTEMTLKETKYYSPQMSRVLPSEPPTSSIVPTDNTTTPAMRLQKHNFSFAALQRLLEAEDISTGDLDRGDISKGRISYLKSSIKTLLLKKPGSTLSERQVYSSVSFALSSKELAMCLEIIDFLSLYIR
ncbi:hypothetical protein INT48_001612 [Thamnidium elegans]|uniref:Uncharacterized protein n=1 Tax=Thamnidium elegans TaxID=101142 RepID=A0A8H7VS30_9FUNG|nr:hypothetical protein INT48_001612 [Thamnidium elegans]